MEEIWILRNPARRRGIKSRFTFLSFRQGVRRMAWFGGSRNAIEALVEAHYAALYRYAYRLSGSTQVAEDLTQEAFCLAQKSLHQLRDKNRAKSWLFSILRNAYLHH